MSENEQQQTPAMEPIRLLSGGLNQPEIVVDSYRTPKLSTYKHIPPQSSPSPSQDDDQLARDSSKKILPAAGSDSRKQLRLQPLGMTQQQQQQSARSIGNQSLYPARNTTKIASIGDFLERASDRVVNGRVTMTSSSSDNAYSSKHSSGSDLYSVTVTGDGSAIHSATRSKRPQSQSNQMEEIGGFSLGDDSQLDDELHGYSWHVFSPSNTFRKRMRKFVVHRSWKLLITLLIAVQWLCYAVQRYDPQARSRPDDSQNYVVDYVLMAVFIAYTIEFAVKTVAFGFIFSPGHGVVSTMRQLTQDIVVKRQWPSLKKPPRPGHTYWDYGSNRFDLIVVLSYWVACGLRDTDQKIVLLFRILASLRPFRLLLVTRGLTMLSSSLLTSGRLLRKVVTFLLFFYVFYGLFATQLFRGVMTRKCVLATMQPDGKFNNAIVQPSMSCGGHTLQNGQEVGYAYSSAPASGYTCPYPQQCKAVDITGQRPYGFINYDNIASSMFSIYQSSSEQGWTQTMYNTQDATNQFALLFHLLTMITIDMVLLNMLVAVVADTFSNIHARYQQAQLNESRRKIIFHQTADGGWTLNSDDVLVDDRSRYFAQAQRIQNSKWYAWVVAVAAGLSLLSLVLQVDAGEYYRLGAAQIFEGVLWWVFAGEMVVAWLARKKQEPYFTSPHRLYDLFSLVVCAVILQQGIYGTYVYKYLTVFQILRVYKVLPVIPGLRKIIRTAFGNLSDVLNAVLFFTLMLGVFATVCMQLFGGQFDFVDKSVPNTNFDTFPEAFLTTFQIMVSDNWTDPLYSGLYSQYHDIVGFVIAAVFYVFLFLFVHNVTVDLAVSVLLDNFELDEAQKKFGQVEQLLQRIDNKGILAHHGARTNKWNLFRFFPPSPRLLDLSLLPRPLRMSIRKVVYNEYLHQYGTGAKSEEVKDKKLTRLDQVVAAVYTTLVKMRIVAAEQAVKRINTRSDPKSGTDYDSLQSQDSYGTGQGMALTDKKLAVLIADNRHELDVASVHTGDNPNFQMLNAAFDEEKFNDAVEHYAEVIDQANEFKEAHPLYDTSYFIFAPDNFIRKWCRAVVGETHSKQRHLFNAGIAVCVIISTCIFVAENSPMDRLQILRGQLKKYEMGKNITVTESMLADPDAELLNFITASNYNSQTFRNSEYFFGVIFLLEFLMRTIAHGVLLSPEPYLLDGWNWMDMLSLLCTWAVLLFHDQTPFGAFRFIRAARAARPVRLINHIDSMKQVFMTVLTSLPQIFNSLVLLMFMIVPYGIYGLTLFNKLFMSCNDTSVANVRECAGIYMNGGYPMPRVWDNLQVTNSFDNLGMSFLALFEMIMEEGWMNKLFAGIMNNGVIGDNPQWPPQSVWNAFYFLIWMLLGYVTLRNLFVGVILQAFMTRDGTALLTNEQRRWKELQTKVKQQVPSKKRLPYSDHGFRRWCFSLIKDKRGYLMTFMYILLGVNTLVLATEFQNYHQLDNGDIEELGTVQSILDQKEGYFFFFTMVFWFKTTIKLIGIGWPKWKRSKWNVFDGLILLALVPIVFIRIADLDLAWGYELDFWNAQKILLDLLCLKLIQFNPTLKGLFKTISASGSAVMNLLGVIFLMFAAYAMFTVELFGLTRFGNIVDQHANFRSFGVALLTLFRMTTGEVWNGIQNDSRVESPNCIYNANSYLLTDCGSSGLAIATFVPFELLCTMMIMSLFVATVISTFDSAQEDSAHTLATDQDLATFRENWIKFDPDGTGFIPKDKLVEFLRLLEGRLDLKVYRDSMTVAKLKVHKMVVTKTDVKGDVSDRNMSQTGGAKKATDSGKLLNIPKSGSAGNSMSMQQPSKTATLAVSDQTATDMSKSENSMDRKSDAAKSDAAKSNAMTEEKNGGGKPLIVGLDAKYLTPSINSDDRSRKSSEAAIFEEYRVMATNINDALMLMDQETVRMRRYRFNFAYQEIMSYATENGRVPFDKVLRTLSYLMIDSDDYLKIEQIYVRQQEVIQVKNAMYHQKIDCLFRTLITKQRYRKLVHEMTRSASGIQREESGIMRPSMSQGSFGNTKLDAKVLAQVSLKKLPQSQRSLPRPLVSQGNLVIPSIVIDAGDNNAQAGDVLRISAKDVILPTVVETDSPQISALQSQVSMVDSLSGDNMTDEQARQLMHDLQHSQWNSEA